MGKIKKMHPRIDIICDYVMVKIDDEFNRFLGVVTDENGNEHQLLVDSRWRPEHHVKVSAEVIAVPGYLSGKDSPVYEKYPGMPRPKAYRGNDEITRIINGIAKQYQKLPDKQVPYSCGGFTPKMVTHFGVPVEVLPKDKVYFHYASLLKEENYMYRDGDGKMVYKIPYTELFCQVREGQIYMLNGNVLVSEFYDEDLEDVEVGDHSIRAKVKSGLVIQIGEKPKYLTGVLRYIGTGIGDQTRKTCAPGELIMFRPSSEFKNTIEGVEYYVMKQWDIVAKVLRVDKETDDLLSMYAQVEVNNLLPVGDYLLIDPEDVDFMPSVKKRIYDPTKEVQDFKPGELFVLRETISHEKTNKFLKHGVGTVISGGELNDGRFTGKRVAYGKGHCYLYLQEYKKVLIRYRDVFGEFIEDLKELSNGVEQN